MASPNGPSRMSSKSSVAEGTQSARTVPRVKPAKAETLQAISLASTNERSTPSKVPTKDLFVTPDKSASGPTERRGVRGRIVPAQPTVQESVNNSWQQRCVQVIDDFYIIHHAGRDYQVSIREDNEQICVAETCQQNSKHLMTSGHFEFLFGWIDRERKSTEADEAFAKAVKVRSPIRYHLFGTLFFYEKGDYRKKTSERFDKHFCHDQKETNLRLIPSGLKGNQTYTNCHHEHHVKFLQENAHKLTDAMARAETLARAGDVETNPGPTRMWDEMLDLETDPLYGSIPFRMVFTDVDGAEKATETTITDDHDFLVVNCRGSKQAYPLEGFFFFHGDVWVLPGVPEHEEFHQKHYGTARQTLEPSAFHGCWDLKRRNILCSQGRNLDVSGLSDDDFKLLWATGYAELEDRIFAHRYTWVDSDLRFDEYDNLLDHPAWPDRFNLAQQTAEDHEDFVKCVERYNTTLFDMKCLVPFLEPIGNDNTVIQCADIMHMGFLIFDDHQDAHNVSMCADLNRRLAMIGHRSRFSLWHPIQGVSRRNFL